jgi:predicted transcriptional regulator
MRSTKVLSITMPPEMLARAVALARRENRTMSELVREAVRQYERLRWWEETNAYGRARAQALGLDEEAVDRVIHEFRQGNRPRRKRPAR